MSDKIKPGDLVTASFEHGQTRDEDLWLARAMFYSHSDRRWKGHFIRPLRPSSHKVESTYTLWLHNIRPYTSYKQILKALL